MQSSQGHGPGRHGFGGLFRAIVAAGQDDTVAVLREREGRRRVEDHATRFFHIPAAEQSTARTLTANGRKKKVNGRDVLTKWDGQRLISETTVGDAKVTDTYERSASAPQLILTTRMDMRGHGVSVRRVYDPASLR